MNSVPSLTLNDGTRIPQLGLGVGRIDGGEVARVIEAAFEVGFRHMDTAQMYGNEAAVGKAIAASGLPRDEVFVTTKLQNSDHLRADARKALTQSLENLQVDYLDLYLIHWPATVKYGNAYVEAWQALTEAKSEGLVRSVGVSNFNVEHLNLLHEFSDTQPSINQVECHPTFTQPVLSGELARREIVLEAWSPFALGQDLKEPEITAIAGEVGKSPAQVIIGWHLQKGHVVIPKSANPERIAENIDVFDFALSQAQLDRIDALNRNNRIGDDPVTADF